MSEHAEGPRSPEPSWGKSLGVLGGVLAGAGMFLGGWWYYRSLAEDIPGLGPQGVQVALTGLAGGGLLVCAAWLVRSRSRQQARENRLPVVLASLQRSLEEMRTADPTPPPVPVETDRTLDADLLRAILEQLRDLNANVLLPEDQRQHRQETLRQDRARQLVEQIESALADGAVDQADELLQSLREEYPDDQRLGDLSERIGSARQSVVKALVDGQIQRATDLMSVSRFDEALSLAQELEERYPDEPETRDLLQRVRREAGTFRNEQRRRLLALVNEHGQARQWRRALEAAHKLLNDYPDSDEADRVRAMMHTLVDNARIEEVRDQRDRFRDLMERRRYAEAARLAEEIIQNYPESAAAEDLRAQLPRLRELASQPGQSPPIHP